MLKFMCGLVKHKKKPEPIQQPAPTDNPYDTIDDATIKDVDKAIDAMGIRNLFSLSFEEHVRSNQTKGKS